MQPPRQQCLTRSPLTLLYHLSRQQAPPPFLLPLTLTRLASHASQGRANKAAQGPGKRLGAKRAASELVVPGNIIFRQRGTHWFPGENCGMGRDHTIFAKEKGYVTFYRDPERHKERKYIGVVFERGMRLPVPRDQPRRRRLGLVGRVREMSTSTVPPAGTTAETGGAIGLVEVQGTRTPRQADKKARARVPEEQLMKLRPGYQYRESNWSIGRAAERAGVKVRVYKRGDRFLAWRKREEAKKRSAEKRSLGSRKKKKGGPK